MEALGVHLVQARRGVAVAMSNGLSTLCLCACTAALL
jgi:hypothetical protein